MNVFSLFSGIGGFELAFQRLGVPTVAAVEKDKAARGVLADRFPDTQLMTDVTKVTGAHAQAAGFVPEHGVLTAGWPCQGNSVAGRRGGMDDPRSGLWRHVVRLLAKTRPRWFFGENVPGLFSVNDGADFYRVINDLDDLGYGVAWRVLDAQFFGVPQRRRRVFIVGCLGDGAAPAQVLLEPEGSGRDSAPRRAQGEDVAGTLASGSPGGGWRVGADEAAAGQLIPFDAAQITHPENRSNPQPGDPAPSIAATGQPMVASTLTSNPGGGGRRQEDDWNVVTHTLTAEGADASEDGTGRGTPLVGFHLTQDPISGNDVPALGAKSGGNGVFDTHVRRLTPRECERLQGYPDDWTLTSNGKPQTDAPRYRQLGNSVAVPTVLWVARRIVAADERRAA